ncbi:hypothetical protein TIFTF001_009136 [Ficus carica]|uniref:non-specific serine/threonine protein kinase n=1 Tax=Ficus carica TaxID=3494 RepID=A0AA87ZML4_FICCA|nr:hypothetical protein TIFTF001_009136 [Ficus carica]
MSSPSPENLSPATSQPLPILSPSSPPPQPPQIISPFPSPLLPSPPDLPATPPPVISPAAGDPLPLISPPLPPPVTPLPPPSSSSSSPPAPAPEMATARPPAELPVSPPSPLISSPPPSPVVASPPPLPPAPKSLPPPPPEPPSPSAAAPPPQAPAPEISNPPLPSAPQIPSTPPIPFNTPSPPPVSVVTPSPSSNNSSITSPPPIMDSPQTPTSSSSSSTPLPSSFSPPVPSSAANGSLPAAVQIQKPGRSVNLSPGFIIGFAAVAFVVVALIFLVVACICQKRRRRRSHPALPKSTSFGSKGENSVTATTLPQHSHLRQPAPIKSNAATITSWIDSESNIPSPPQSNFSTSHGIFTYDQLVVATNGFSESNLIGEGGFGYVYKGVLMSGKEVAVKQLRTGSWQGEREFQAEVDIISRVHHKHLVSLVGYCITGAERLLVYEFVPNNTLEFHLHGEQQEAMEWATRLKIAIGSAKGLAYLHEDCNPKIIHRDIKASNILLDFRFEAKARPLLAQALEDGYYNTLVDPRLQRNYDAVEMSRMISCAAACVRHSAWLRPRMIQIVHALEGHTSLMDLREGIVPGSSTVYSSRSSSYNTHQYKNDLNKFHITIADQENGSTTYSGSTSQYGLNPSVSSSEAHQTLRN